MKKIKIETKYLKITTKHSEWPNLNILFSFQFANFLCFPDLTAPQEQSIDKPGFFN